jgi:hypothetical protein
MAGSVVEWSPIYRRSRPSHAIEQNLPEWFIWAGNEFDAVIGPVDAHAVTLVKGNGLLPVQYKRRASIALNHFHL